MRLAASSSMRVPVSPTARSLFVLGLVSLVGCVSPFGDDGGGGGGGGHGCTLIGCVNGAQMSVTVDASADWLRTSTLEVCRNGVCGHATPSQLPTATGSGTGAQLTGALTGSLTVWTASTGFRLDLQIGLGEPSSSFANGDTYTVKLTGADGAVAGSFDRTATYVDSYPNGKDCDPTPCREATLEGASIHVP
jgi:hypothetical protein